LQKHRDIVVARRVPVECIFPAFSGRLKRGPALCAACTRATAPRDTLLSDGRQSVGTSQVIQSTPSAPLRPRPSVEESRTLAQNESMQEIAVFPSPVRVAEHNFDVASVRKDRKFVLRRISSLITVMGPRMSMSSRGRPSRCDGRCSLCRRWRRRMLRWVWVDRCRVPRDHVCDVVARRTRLRLCAR
jgi:hypothetical protein